MSVTVYRIDNEPILIATFTGTIDAALMQSMYEQSAALISEREIVFRVTDFRQITTSFEEVLRIFAAASADTPASTSDPRIRPVLLGDNQWSRIAQDVMARSGGMQIPIFSSMGEAMQYIRVLLAGRAS